MKNYIILYILIISQNIIIYNNIKNTNISYFFIKFIITITFIIFI